MFQILRAYWFSSEYGHLVKDERKKLLKPEVVWNIEKGLDLEFEQVNDAVKRRNVLVDEMQRYICIDIHYYNDKKASFTRIKFIKSLL